MARFPQLSRLLDPIPAETFLRDYWEQRPLHVTGGAMADAPPLLSLEEFDQVLTSRAHKFPDMQMVDARNHLAPEDYTEGADVIDPILLARRFAGGSSVVMNRVDEASLRIRNLCVNLENELGIESQANMYLTPPGAQGFPVHFDSHDVLLVQCVGSKNWRLYDSPRGLPMRGQQFSRDVDKAGECSQNLVLRPGEVLYIPRGLMHDAVADGDGISLHITIGLHAVRWSEVLIEALAAKSLNDVELRRGLPLGLLSEPGNDEAVRTALRARLEELIETIRWDEIRPRLHNQLLDRRRDRVPGILVDSQGALTEAMTFAVREGVHVTIVREGDELIFAVNGRQTRWPARAEQVLADVIARRRFTLADLDPTLDDAGKRTLVRRLIVEGCVTVVR